MSSKRFIGLDIGAETLKVVELVSEEEGGELRWTGRWIREHNKDPGRAVMELISEIGWEQVAGAAASGRLSRQVRLPRVPVKQAQARGYRFLFTDETATLVSIGSHGFSVLELRPSGVEVFRENSRCSQGTGNFLRQLVERFDLSVEEASALCADVPDPAPLSGRCPVILKTDMTHLANRGESRARILAGLYDAVCENVQVLIKPRISPPKVVLLGGVTRAKRIRDNFRDFLGRHEMALDITDDDDALYIEALGSAVTAAERPSEPPPLERLLALREAGSLERVDALSAHLGRVRRMPALPPVDPGDGPTRELIVGFDIGSTGSKAVALDRESREVVWEGYVSTNGDPVGAAQALAGQYAASAASRHPLLAVGATGSGREIVGSLLSTCYGASQVYVLNEIAAHAEGARHHDERVDTIFEIGGQDAKYIRLAGGRVVDAAMNEACSAGTGSFIEEQGRKFSGIEDVVQLGMEALQADHGISLGQHCSVFMAEIIDEAVAAGEDRRAIIAGIYDAIIQNYLNRVKGSRDVGQVIFCQGMPFSADALAAAVARQTGGEVITPPNPGTVGALGIALLARRHLQLEGIEALQIQRVLDAAMLKKDTFVCKAKQGCGGSGNKCRIDRISTRVAGKRQRFTWGGGCSLYERGTGKIKLPDLAPDPFREREELVRRVVGEVSAERGRPRVAMTDEFLLKSVFPFFATFAFELGLDVEVTSGADQRALKRGIEEANVPFCAPMQQYHGLMSAMAETRPDYLLMPMLRTLPRVGDERIARVCPVVQGSSDIVRWNLGPEHATRAVRTVVDFGPGNLRSREFAACCRRMAMDLGAPGERRFSAAFERALAVQTRFDADCLELGRAALRFCEERQIIPVVILGRAYTIYNTVLNSNVPAIMREQGAIPIPMDCYEVEENAPVFNDIYWGYGQRNLRVAHQIRRSPDQYSLFCSNYSCGPDSFVIHFYSYIMEGRPFAVIETDGHSGDAGTKTRVEAFLHCVREDLGQTREHASAGRRGASARAGDHHEKRPNQLKLIELDTTNLPEIRRRDELLLLPRMGPGAEAVAACFRGIGIPAQALDMPDRETVRMGRRHTSGKECVPMTITIGSLLQRLEHETDPDRLFCLLMPRSLGPCRLGMYNVLHKIVLRRLGMQDRVRVWSPVDTDYFSDLPQGFVVLLFAAFMSNDLLLEGRYHVRPVESEPGAAIEIYERYRAELNRLLEEQVKGDLSLPTALLQVASGRLFGCADLLSRASDEYAQVMTDRRVPRVVIVGEIYVRCDPFANDFTIEKLEERGIRCHFAPFHEWLEYADYINWKTGDASTLGDRARSLIQARIMDSTYDLVAAKLGWGKRTRVRETLTAACGYISPDLHGEAVLTLGGPIHEWREGHIDGVVSVGPLECMPNKVCEAQFFHVAEQEGLPALTLSLNGDPMNPEVLDNFAFEVQSQFRAEGEHHEARESHLRLARRLWSALGRSPGEENGHHRRPVPAGIDVSTPIHVEELPEQEGEPFGMDLLRRGLSASSRRLQRS